MISPDLLDDISIINIWSPAPESTVDTLESDNTGKAWNFSPEALRIIEAYGGLPQGQDEPAFDTAQFAPETQRVFAAWKTVERWRTQIRDEDGRWADMDSSDFSPRKGAIRVSRDLEVGQFIQYDNEKVAEVLSVDDMSAEIRDVDSGEITVVMGAFQLMYTSSVAWRGAITDGEADIYLDGAFQEWGESLSEDELSALKAYRRYVEFRLMNARLRKGDVELLTGIGPKSVEEIDGLITDMDAAIDRAPAISPTIETHLFRGVSDMRYGLKDPKVGDTIEEKAFMSTTTDVYVALNYGTPQSTDAPGGGPSRAGLLKIIIPPGTKGAWMKAHEDLDDSGNKEFVLPRGSQFRVVENVGNEDAMTAPDLVLELIPPKMSRVSGKAERWRTQDRDSRGRWADELDSLMPEGSAGGTNDARWFRDFNGDRWVGKNYGGDEERVRTEYLASRIYKALGVPVPESGIVEMEGKLHIATREVIGDKMGSYTMSGEAAESLRKGFAVDVLTANYDAFGVGPEDPGGNIIYDDAGRPNRVDLGGTFDYRGLMGRKEYLDDPMVDFEGFQKSGRKHAIAIQADNWPNRDAEIRAQLERLRVLNDGLIDRLVDKADMPEDRARELSSKLKKRRDALLTLIGRQI